jgi:hypothetical protein
MTNYISMLYAALKRCSATVLSASVMALPEIELFE